MAIWMPPGVGQFGWQKSNVETTRPQSSFGTSIIPGNNTMGTAVQILSASDIAHDVYGLLLNVNNSATGGQARDILVDILVDPTNTSTWKVLCPTLLASCAIAYTGQGGGGVSYWLPMFVPAGSQIGARSSVNNATPNTMRIAITAYGRPARPVRAARYCTAFGITAGSSTGTSFTCGSTSEGSWTAVGSTLALPHWGWEIGFGINNSAMNSLDYHLDLAIGDGSTKHLIGQDMRVWTSNSEQMLKPLVRALGYDGAVGDQLYMRGQCGGTPDSGINFAAYGFGGG